MKKTIITAFALVFITASSFAQDDKKQEPKKKEEKKTEQEPAPGGTRMAINEKGLPGKKKTNTASSTSKTDESKKEEPKKEEPKKHD